MQLLPLLRGWKWDLKLNVVKAVPAGQRVSIFNSRDIKATMMGFVWSVSGISDDPLIQLEIVHYDRGLESRPIIGSPFILNAAGLNAWTANGFYCPMFSIANDIFVAVYAPDSKMGSFSEQLHINLINPTANVVNTSYSHVLVLVTDEKEFRKSLHQALQSNVFKVRSAKK